MKNVTKLIGIIALTAIIGFAFITCDDGNNNNNNNNGGQTPNGDPRPTAPEAMSDKTAMQYFTDEGIKIGINAGNSLDAVDSWTNSGKPFSIETAWGNPKLNQAYFNGLKTLGFDIVRVPVTWFGHIGSAPNYKIEEAWLARVAEVVGYAHTAGLKVFINIHHDGHHEMGGGGWLLLDRAMQSTANYNQIMAQYEAVWKQIAEYFINYGDYLMFQAFNEIQRGDWQENGTQAEYNVINAWNQKFTDVVRATGGNNAKRYLLYYGYMVSSGIADSAYFQLPTDTATGRQIVGFHYYKPWSFSGEAVDPNWSTEASDKANIDAEFGKMKTKFVNNGIPVIIGENGPFAYVNHAANPGYSAANAVTAHTKRLAYIDYMYGKARENGIVPHFWENGFYETTYTEGDASLINRSNGQPNSTASNEVIQHMISAINNATPPTTGGKTITISPNEYGDPLEQHGWQAKLSLSEFLGSSTSFAIGDTFTLTYTFTSNVAITNLQAVIVDISPPSYWTALTDYAEIGTVTVGTPVNATKTITASVAGVSSNANTQFIFNIGETSGAASEPTLIFTVLTLVKN